MLSGQACGNLILQRQALAGFLGLGHRVDAGFGPVQGAVHVVTGGGQFAKMLRRLTPGMDGSGFGAELFSKFMRRIGRGCLLLDEVKAEGPMGRDHDVVQRRKLTQIKAQPCDLPQDQGARDRPAQRRETTMIRRILCPTDGTDHATNAVELAADLAQKYGAELLLCVVNVAHGGGRGPLIHHWTDAEAQNILDDATATAKAHGTTPTGTATVIDREPASGIIAYAEMNKVDHIVIGTGDKRGFSRLMLGSVAADVAGRGHCTVTIAR